MSNKTIEKLTIDSRTILENMAKAGYSIRRLAKAIEYDESTIRRYLKKGEMPPIMFERIRRVLHPGKHLLKATFEVTLNAPEWLIKEIMEKADTDGRFELKGFEAERLRFMSDITYERVSINVPELDQYRQLLMELF